MMTQTERAQAARSIAPPTSGPLSGTRLSQFAMSPFSATSKQPRIVTSICPPRIMAKLSAECTIDAPLRSVTRRLPASTRSGSAAFSDANGPQPMMPFSDWMNTSRSAGT